LAGEATEVNPVHKNAYTGHLAFKVVVDVVIPVAMLDIDITVIINKLLLVHAVAPRWTRSLAMAL
jgi:hypothetical protein